MKAVVGAAGTHTVAIGAALAASFVVSLQDGEKSLDVDLADKDFVAALDHCAAHPKVEKMQQVKSSELVPATEADIAGALRYTLTEKQAAARDLAKLLSVVQAVDEKIKPSTPVLDADQRDALARMLISTSLSAELRRNLCIFAKVVEANQDRLEEGSPWIKHRLETVAELIKAFGVEVVVKSDGVESKVVQDMKEWSTRYDNASDLLTALRKNTERYEAPTPEGFQLPNPVETRTVKEVPVVKAETPAAEAVETVAVEEEMTAETTDGGEQATLVAESASAGGPAKAESKPRRIVLTAPSFTSVKGTAYNESVAPYYQKMSLGLLADAVAPPADAPFKEPTLAPRDLAVADAA